jgi:hypothetical protein
MKGSVILKVLPGRFGRGASKDDPLRRWISLQEAQSGPSPFEGRA